MSYLSLKKVGYYTGSFIVNFFFRKKCPSPKYKYILVISTRTFSKQKRS